jgi:hypothetical protein
MESNAMGIWSEKLVDAGRERALGRCFGGSDSGGIERSVDLAVCLKPSDIAAFGARLNFAQKLDGLRLVAGLTGIHVGNDRLDVDRNDELVGSNEAGSSNSFAG